MITLKKILFPTDFSDSSLEALKYAITLARDYKAKLIVMHVIDEKFFSEGLGLARAISFEEMEKEMKQEAEKQLKVIIPSEEGEGIERETLLCRGTPFLEIIKAAHEKSVDLIVIGSHGRSGLEHIIFGSTAQKVVRKAPCPVLSVKPPEREFVMP